MCGLCSEKSDERLAAIRQAASLSRDLSLLSAVYRDLALGELNPHDVGNIRLIAAQAAVERVRVELNDWWS